MYHLIDLTLTLRPGPCIYARLIPDLPAVRIESFARVAEHGFSTDVFHFPALAGTYLETSAHVFPNGPALETIPPDRFIRPAAVIQLPEQAANADIGVDLLRAYAPEINPGDAVLIASGWEAHHDSEDYLAGSPSLTREAAAWLMGKKPSIIGGDLTTNDNPATPQGVNEVIFGEGALLLAPLINLRAITQSHVTLFALPAKIAGVCGAPCRALAMQQLS
jgi:arylformamidase